MKPYTLDFQDPHSAFDTAQGVAPRAGIFLLEGRYHVAAPMTSAERRLLDLGAIAVATVRFDGSHPDQRPLDPAARLRPLHMHDLAARMKPAFSRN
ncbi:MAG TPA: hypothetical protein VFE05_12205 [Longimicrobiaceae bacterium]|jgi:hypothetical protein|nr:hypothetical protein [Longimicrobiaceae bacterium]